MTFHYNSLTTTALRPLQLLHGICCDIASCFSKNHCENVSFYIFLLCPSSLLCCLISISLRLIFLVQIRSRHRESLREASLTDRVDAAVFLCPLCSLTTIGHFCAPLGAVRGPPSDADAVGSGHHHRRRSRCHHPQPHLVLFFSACATSE